MFSTVEFTRTIHVTIVSGTFVDYLLTLDPKAPCDRELGVQPALWFLTMGSTQGYQLVDRGYGFCC
jgi:hypothetical protein